MSSVRLSTVTRQDHTQSELEELRRPIVRPLLIPLIVVWWVETAFITDTRLGESWIGVGILTVVIVAAYLLQPSSLFGASLVVVVGVGAYATNLLVWHPDGFAPYLFPLIVFMAGALLRVRFCVFVASAASAVLLSVYLRDVAPLAQVHLIGSLALTWTSAFVAWLTARPVHVALDWSWSSYVTVLQKVEELHDRQGVLNRTLKALNEACYRLEQANAELTRARLQADEARRLKAEFATNLSHELRAPLNLIIGFSEMIVMAPESYDGERLPDVYRGDIEAIYRNACHLSSLIDDVLDLGQIDADRMALHKEDVPIALIIDEAVTTTLGLFEDKGLTLERDVPTELPTVFVDRTRIRQILMNLLKNAVRFTDEGEVRLSATVSDETVEIAVSDTGIGIPPDELPYVFQEFRQLANAGTRRVGGSGLGLVISRKFAQMHGGDLTVRSEAGRGSTFTLVLPLARDPVTTDVTSSSATWVRIPTAIDVGRRIVAVVADDDSAVKLFQRHLDGYRVLRVVDPARIPQIAEEFVLDAVIVVEATPGKGGRLATQIRSSVPAVPVICCTLHGFQAARQELGVADYLLKPVTRYRLQKTLRGLGRTVRRLLIVDDDPEMVRLLARMIRSSSRRFQIWTATSSEEALALLRAVQPDAVFLDLLMPGVDGYGLIEALHTDPQFAATPIVVVTAKGRASETIVADAFSLSQAGGLSIRDLMRCLRSSLDALKMPSGSAPASQAASAG